MESVRSRIKGMCTGMIGGANLGATYARTLRRSVDLQSILSSKTPIIRATNCSDALRQITYNVVGGKFDPDNFPRDAAGVQYKWDGQHSLQLCALRMPYPSDEGRVVLQTLIMSAFADLAQVHRNAINAAFISCCLPRTISHAITACTVLHKLLYGKDITRDQILADSVNVVTAADVRNYYGVRSMTRNRTKCLKYPTHSEVRNALTGLSYMGCLLGPQNMAPSWDTCRLSYVPPILHHLRDIQGQPEINYAMFGASCGARYGEQIAESEFGRYLVSPDRTLINMCVEWLIAMQSTRMV